MRAAAAVLLAGGAGAAMVLPPNDNAATLEYVGCYQDNANSRQFVPGVPPRPRFVGMCAEACAAFTYYAIQDATPGGPDPYCYCGNDLGPHARLDDATSCNAGCVTGGDRAKERRCGGELQNAVYRRVPATVSPATRLPPDAVEYVGCYRDADAGGAPQFEVNVGRNPTGAGQGNGIFLTHCSQNCKHYTYFAAQDSTSNANDDGKKSVCYCGNTPDLTGRGRFEKLPDSACPYSGCFARGDRNLQRPCGSSSTRAVYRQVAVPDVAGDPFTTYDGKKVQFYMPVGEETKLLTCGRWQLAGRVMASGIPGDTQQWFDRFRIHVAGKEALVVDTADTAALIPTAGAGGAAADADADDVVVLQGKRVQQALAAAAASTGAERALTTLRVAVDGAALRATTSVAAAGGAVNVTVTQDAARRIGVGYVETVDVAADGVGMLIVSSAASKFATEADRIRKLHMDVAFTHLNATACTGVLPEIWGVRPLSRRTARFLAPQ